MEASPAPRPRRWLERGRAGFGPESDRQIEILEDSVEEGEGAVNLDLDIQHLPEREEEAALQRGEGDDVPIVIVPPLMISRPATR